MNRGVFLAVAAFVSIGLIQATQAVADDRFESPENVIRSVLRACHENDWIAFNEAGLARIHDEGGFASFKEKLADVEELKLEQVNEPTIWKSYTGKDLGLFYYFTVIAVTYPDQTSFRPIEFPLWNVTVRCAKTTRYAIWDLIFRRHPIQEKYCVIQDLKELAD